MNVRAANTGDDHASQLSGLRVIALAPVSAYGGHNTSRHRIEALESLGCRVHVINSNWDNISAFADIKWRLSGRLFRHGLAVSMPDPAGDNTRLLSTARQGHWDLIWLDKALTIHRETLEKVVRYNPTARIVGFSPDDMSARHSQSQQFLEALPAYDFFITTKSYNVAELRNLGCHEVIFVGNGFDPKAFRPMPVSSEDRVRLGGDVGFIGSFERERAATMYYLATQGTQVRVWGDGWHKMRRRHPNLTIEKKPLFGDDFAKACGAFKINLGFLRKINRDLQTTRSVEIPACGGFMLAERTDEHLELFEEGQEAEFFSSREELLLKCRRYLHDEHAREMMARRGYERCLSSGYMNAERLRMALRVILNSGPEAPAALSIRGSKNTA